MGKLVFHQEDLQDRSADLVFPIGAFPQAPPPDTRPKKVATERMLWKRDGSLAAAPGHSYFEHDEPNLITQDEWMALQPK